MNDFEKNPLNHGDNNDTASEIINNVPKADAESAEIKATEPVTDIIEKTEEVQEEYVQPVSEEVSEEAVTEEAFPEEPEEVNDYSVPDYESVTKPMEPKAEEHPAASSYEDPGDHHYTKPGDGSSPAVGYVWDSSAYAEKSEKKKRKSTGGFKVFVAVMLTVFTVSVVAIAAFLAIDYINVPEIAEDNKVTVSEPQHTPPAQTQSDYTPVSTFTKSTDGLTKPQVAAKCLPSTVGIMVEIEQTYGGYSIFDFGFYPSGTQIFKGVGSGFIYSTDGYIVTNHHVIENANKITVYFQDGTTAPAELIGGDSLSDIAVIKIDATDRTLIPMEIGDSSVINVGDEVIAIGCPARIELMGTVTDGIISATNRNIKLDNTSTTTKTMTLLQTNATINKGNSGGPLINTHGQVIGINTLKYSSEYEGLGFAIPMNGALPIIKQLIEHGEVVERSDSFVSSEGVIGITASEITEFDAEYYDIPQGLLVVQINKDSSASKAGLRRGDIITKFNGTEVHTVNELNRLKYEYNAGDEVTVTVYRDSVDSSETFDITFKLDVAE